MERVYENIRTLRVLRGYPQKYLADLLDIHQSTYSRIERGKSVVTLPILNKICSFYKINLEVLVEADLAKEAQMMSEKKK